MLRTILVLITCAVIVHPVQAKSLEYGQTICQGVVTHVSDGDTVHLICKGSSKKLKIRIAEIDTPETPKTNKACYGQPYGLVAKEMAKALLLDKTVQAVFFDKDRYGRIVARLYIDGQSYSQLLVARGVAHTYRQYARDPKLLTLESQARRENRGMWSLPKTCIVSPKDWRRIRNKCAKQTALRNMGCFKL